MNLNNTKNEEKKLMSEKTQKVYEILLTPIICDKDFQKIEIQNGIIKSPQLYYGMADADMSDLSIGFYKIIYKDLLSNSNGEILDERGYPINKEFMGDTMHSFNSIASIILNDKSKKFRSPIEKWPQALVEYHSRYHCLVNFWIIPMRHGRKSAKLSKYDSLDCYLNKVEECLINDVEGYFGNFKSLENFMESQYISNYIFKANPLLMYKSKDKNCCIRELECINDFWKSRANEIVNKKADELYEYFYNLGLIQSI